MIYLMYFSFLGSLFAIFDPTGYLNFFLCLGQLSLNLVFTSYMLSDQVCFKMAETYNEVFKPKVLKDYHVERFWIVTGIILGLLILGLLYKIIISLIQLFIVGAYA